MRQSKNPCTKNNFRDECDPFVGLDVAIASSAPLPCASAVAPYMLERAQPAGAAAPPPYNHKRRYNGSTTVRPYTIGRVGLEPTTCGLTHHFGFRRRAWPRRAVQRAFVVRTLSSPASATVRWRPSSLYTSPAATLGLARRWDLTPFADVERIHAHHF